MGKERGSLEGENLRDRDRGGSPSPCSLWLSPANNSTKHTDLYSELEKCYPKKSTIPLAKDELLLLSFAQPTIEGLLQYPSPRTIPYHTHKQQYQIHRYITKRLSVKKRATGTFFEDKKQYKISSGKLFILQKVSLTLQKFALSKDFAFCGKRFKAPP